MAGSATTQRTVDDWGEHVTDVTYRPGARGAFPLLAEMYVERGNLADWDLLKALHYKMGSLPVSANYWRLRLRGETIGVCVMGRSKPMLKERHAMFPTLKPGRDTQSSNIKRFADINDQFRTIGRFVIDTMFRSCGCAYRFANLAARLHRELADDSLSAKERKTIYTVRHTIGFKRIEIISSMSKYNHFAQRAGFQMAKPIQSLYYDKGLSFMRRWFAAHPADLEAVHEEYNAMPPGLQQRASHAMREFYFGHAPLEKTGDRRHYAQSVVNDWPIETVIAKIQGLCFASPLYGVYRNPEVTGNDTGIHRLAGVARLPLLAFDLQSPSEPVRLNLLDTVPGWDAIQRQILLDGADGAEQAIAIGADERADDESKDELGTLSDDTGEGRHRPEPEHAPRQEHRRTRAEHRSPR